MAPPDLIPHSCRYCQKLVINIIKSMPQGTRFPSLRRMLGLSAQREDPGWRMSLVHNAVFDFTVQDIAKAARGGCNFCQWFLDTSEAHLHVRSGGHMLYAKFSLRSGDRIEFFGLLKRNEKPVAKTPIGFTLCTTSDNVAAQTIRTRPMNLHPASDDTFRLVRNWAKECLEFHRQCRTPMQSFMPTRLVEIVESEGQWQLRLTQMSGKQAAAYTVLSYCWGGDQPLKATKATLHKLETEILFDELPQTIKDAVVVARKLDSRFLWVDSLCIIQDDIDDVAQEISQMPKIYNSARVAIAASRATSVHEGFLQDRNKTDFPHLQFELPFRNPRKGTIGSVTLLSQNNPWPKEPLDTRGWALQERLLAPRILEYGTRQLRWMCSSVDQKKPYTDGWRESVDVDHSRVEYFDREVLGLGVEQNYSQQDRAHNLEKAISEWHSLLLAYTNRELTVPTDRILAISGIADRFGKVFQGGYLAGLWETAFPSELLWIIENPTRRPQVYQGPSWSWTSINGAIDRHSAKASANEEACLQLISHQIELTNRDAPYGAVQCGRLTVRGRAMPARWMREAGATTADFKSILRKRGVDGLDGELAARIHHDALENEFAEIGVDSIPVLLLETTRSPLPFHLIGAHRCQGLVLRKIDEFRFSRLGVFEFLSEILDEKEWERRVQEQLHWFHGCEPQTITIE